MQRNSGIDVIRIVLTALVVFHHTAIAYGGSGGWYWREQPDFSNLWLVSFNCINQSFFMGFFFLLAGYFTKAALGRKSGGRFVRERLLRLGVPLLVYFFVLSPVTVALAVSGGGDNVFELFVRFFLESRFGPGPLWFVAALLVMTFVYLLWHWSVGERMPRIERLPGFGVLLVVLLGLGAVSFAIRLWVPVGEEVLWMQLGYFTPYVFLFVVGCLGYESRLLERIRLRDCLPWFVVSAALLPVMLYLIVVRPWEGGFHGGWNANALFYALWDPLFATGVILGALWFFQRGDTAKRPHVSRWFADRAYTIFIIHPPVVVAISLAAASWNAAPVLKFLVVGVLAFIGCALIASPLLRVPYARRIL